MDGGTLSHRAEVFRSKLIEDFQIQDSLTKEGREKAPIYNSSDVTCKMSGCCAYVARFFVKIYQY